MRAADVLCLAQPLFVHDSRDALPLHQTRFAFNVRCCFVQIPNGDLTRIPARVLRTMNVAIVTSDSHEQNADQWWFSACSLAGSMSERVFVKLSADSDSGKVVVDVYSDNAMLPRKLVGPLTKGLEGNGR